MSNLFSGLEDLGFKDLSNIEIYETKKESEAKEAVKEVEPQEEDFIFEKTYNCPACHSEFKSKATKAGRVKLISLDTDLRPRYQNVDALKYDAIVCPSCGFAAIARYFKYLSNIQINSIKEQITSSFRGIKNDNLILSYDDAILRHKLSLISTIAKKGKNSEKAYTCLKTAWVIRGKRESLEKDIPNYEEEVKALEKEEYGFIKNAYDGFIAAFSTEDFPMAGMDEITTTLLVAELARRVGDKEEASRWISRILVSREANDRIKERAREIKELL